MLMTFLSLLQELEGYSLSSLFLSNISQRRSIALVVSMIEAIPEDHGL